MKIFTASQIRQWDAFTIANEPISSIDLMERAARKCFDWIFDKFRESNSFSIFCGTGNNGGDGLAIARMLFTANKKVEVYILDSENKSPDFLVNFGRLKNLPIVFHFISSADQIPSLDKSQIIIDALFGTGLNKPVSGLAADLIQIINQSNLTIISIDLPSGLFADISSQKNIIVKATHTISFQIMKLAFLFAENQEYFGQVHIEDIGLHQQFYKETPTLFQTIDKKIIQTIYKPRDQFAHKYNFGHALLYAGSKNMTGAAILCAKACLRSGTGLVTIHTDENKQSLFQIALPEAITSAEIDFGKLSAKKTAIGIGPGLDISEYNQELLEFIIAEWTGPLLIDASALQILSNNIKILHSKKGIPLILTPHTGEFEKLFGKAANDFERIDLGLQKSKEYNCIIVLKGHHTAIICPDGEVYFNTTGNSGMATAGSGDVLTGMVTGLLAQNYTPKDACIFGVYLHGTAGDIAAKHFSEESLISGDIIEHIGSAFKSLK